MECSFWRKRWLILCCKELGKRAQGLLCNSPVQYIPNRLFSDTSHFCGVLRVNLPFTKPLDQGIHNLLLSVSSCVFLGRLTNLPSTLHECNRKNEVEWRACLFAPSVELAVCIQGSVISDPAL